MVLNTLMVAIVVALRFSHQVSILDSICLSLFVSHSNIGCTYHSGGGINRLCEVERILSSVGPRKERRWPSRETCRYMCRPPYLGLV